jgi:hypothetical protein
MTPPRKNKNAIPGRTGISLQIRMLVFDALETLRTPAFTLPLNLISPWEIQFRAF